MTESFDPTGGYSRDAQRREARRRLTLEDLKPKNFEDCIKDAILYCQQQGIAQPEQRDVVKVTGFTKATVSRHWPRN